MTHTKNLHSTTRPWLSITWLAASKSKRASTIHTMLLPIALTTIQHHTAQLTERLHPSLFALPPPLALLPPNTRHPTTTAILLQPKKRRVCPVFSSPPLLPLVSRWHVTSPLPLPLPPNDKLLEHTLLGHHPPSPLPPECVALAAAHSNPLGNCRVLCDFDWPCWLQVTQCCWGNACEEVDRNHASC